MLPSGCHASNNVLSLLSDINLDVAFDVTRHIKGILLARELASCIATSDSPSISVSEFEADSLTTENASTRMARKMLMSTTLDRNRNDR